MLLKGELSCVEVLILDRQYPESVDKSDMNWLNSKIKLEVPGFNAYFTSSIHFKDLYDFYHQLLSFCDQQSQSAKFVAIEDDLILNLEATIRGTVFCDGSALYEGNSLKFRFETDLYNVGKCVKNLRLDLDRFPELERL